MKEIKHLSLRIDPDMLGKLRYVSDYNGRSINGELLVLIRKHIEAYETEHGKIKFKVE